MVITPATFKERLVNMISEEEEEEEEDEEINS